MHSLFLNDVKHLSIHGGSLRIYVEKKENPSPAVRDWLRTEAVEKVNQLDYYHDFAERVESIRKELRRLLGVPPTARCSDRSIRSSG